MSSYLTAGEFAKLAGTTKRTVQFYDQKGVLRPTKTNSNGYRFYEESQILDYQMILLLTNFGLTLTEIKSFLQGRGNLSKLFENKKGKIEDQINNLQFVLTSLKKYLDNLKENGTMVSPTIKTLKPFAIYYIEKTGPYAKIEKYCQELAEKFANKGKEFTTLAIFESQTYLPKKSKIVIGALAKKGMQVKWQYKDEVKKMVFNPGKVVTHTHNGEAKLLSLFWKELEKYCRIHNIKPRKNEGDFEIYRKVNMDPSRQFFEIYIPIC